MDHDELVARENLCMRNRIRLRSLMTCLIAVTLCALMTAVDRRLSACFAQEVGAERSIRVRFIDPKGAPVRDLQVGGTQCFVSPPGDVGLFALLCTEERNSKLPEGWDITVNTLAAPQFLRVSFISDHADRLIDMRGVELTKRIDIVVWLRSEAVIKLESASAATEKSYEIVVGNSRGDRWSGRSHPSGWCSFALEHGDYEIRCQGRRWRRSHMGSGAVWVLDVTGESVMESLALAAPYLMGDAVATGSDPVTMEMTPHVARPLDETKEYLASLGICGLAVESLSIEAVHPTADSDVYLRSVRIRAGVEPQEGATPWQAWEDISLYLRPFWGVLAGLQCKGGGEFYPSVAFPRGTTESQRKQAYILMGADAGKKSDDVSVSWCGLIRWPNVRVKYPRK